MAGVKGDVFGDDKKDGKKKDAPVAPDDKNKKVSSASLVQDRFLDLGSHP